MKFSECLKIAREKAGLTQKELAEKLDIPPQMINRYENSDTEPRIGFVVDVANALSISLDELMNTQKSALQRFQDLLAPDFLIRQDGDNYNLYSTMLPPPMTNLHITQAGLVIDENGVSCDIPKEEVLYNKITYSEKDFFQFMKKTIAGAENNAQVWLKEFAKASAFDEFLKINPEYYRAYYKSPI